VKGKERRWAPAPSLSRRYFPRYFDTLAPPPLASKAAATTSATTVSTSDTPSSPPPHHPSPSPPPPVPPLHFAAQTGDLSALYALLPDPSDAPSASTSAPRVTANDLDGQGIPALNWAAINNQVLACKFLLERGANVDAIGGDLSATALHWAAR
jgi:hypothetical protein